MVGRGSYRAHIHLRECGEWAFTRGAQSRVLDQTSIPTSVRRLLLTPIGGFNETSRD